MTCTGENGDTERMAPFDIAEVRARLGEAFTVTHYPAIASTNDRALQLARAGAPGGTLITADFQTAGRGRRGAAWIMPRGGGVLLSWLYRPAQPWPAPHALAVGTGVGVAEGIAALGVDAEIKWPNDVLVHDRKVAGILVETFGGAVVIGVGVNCHVPDDAFPADLRARAGSLHALAGRHLRREDVLVSVLRHLAAACADVEAGRLSDLPRRWNARNWYARRPVRVSGPNGSLDGDGLLLDGVRWVWQVMQEDGVAAMPLDSTVEAR